MDKKKQDSAANAATSAAKKTGDVLADAANRKTGMALDEACLILDVDKSKAIENPSTILEVSYFNFNFFFCKKKMEFGVMLIGMENLSLRERERRN